jgi:hypothetical protein
MIQLTYQPAFDPFHTIFRLLRLRPVLAASGRLHRDHVRLLDFYLVFPFRIEGIRLLPKHRGYRKLASIYATAKPYGDQPDDVTLFGRMEPIQTVALETLATNRVLDASELRADIVVPTDVGIPEELSERVGSANAHDQALVEFLQVLATEYSLSGPNGLKARTGLLEYRYDAL